MSEFSGKLLVSLREYYTDAGGQERPGKKGISLTAEQFRALVPALPRLQAQLAAATGGR